VIYCNLSHYHYDKKMIIQLFGKTTVQKINMWIWSLK